MAEDLNRESSDRERTHRKEQTPAQPAGGEGLFVPEIPFYPGTVLADPRLNGRGNMPVRIAAMQRMQQTYGNRAVQRFLQQQRTASDTPPDAEESGERIEAEGASGSSSLGRESVGPLSDGLGADVQTMRVSSAALPVQRDGDGGQQPQADDHDKDKKKEPMSGELPPIKGEPISVPGGCDDDDLEDGAADSGSDMPARPLTFNVQLDMGAGKSEGIEQYSPGAADAVNSSLTFGSAVSGGGVEIPAGAFGYSQPTFTADNIKWQSENDIITVNARIFIQVNWTIGAPGGQMDVTSADDENMITQNSWEKIVEDLTPDGTGKPKRGSYWVRSITLDHEKFHADEYITRAQGILPAAQSIINRGDIPNHVWTSKVDIINEINSRLEAAKKWMESDVHTFYTSGGEERAYGAGKGAYEALTQAIKAKADAKKWKKKPAAATGAPAQRMSSTSGTQVQRTPADSQVSLQRDPVPGQAPTAGSVVLPKFESWPKDMPRRTVGQVTVKPSQGGADPTTTAPADPASQSSDADRQKAIDAILEKVKTNRAGINERFMRLASTKGYMYTSEQEARSGSGANQQEAAEYEKWRKSDDATPDSVKKNPDDPLVKAQVELWQDIGGEGDPSSMNTWDVMNVTYGRGFAAGGQLQQVMQILFKSDPDAAKIFFEAGIAMEGAQFLVVNLDSKLAEQNDSAEHVIQVDRKLVSLFVNLAQSKEHRKAVVNAQWETFIKNTGNMPPEVVGWGDRKARAVAGHNIHGGNFSWGNFKGDGGSLKKVVATIGYKLGTPASNGTTWVPSSVTRARLQQLAHGWAIDALEKKPYKVVEEQAGEPNSTPNTPEGPHSTAQGESGHIYFGIPGQANSWYELVP